MALEMELLLVSRSGLNNLLERSTAALQTGMEAQALRAMRPAAEPLLHRNFDIDAEAEFLDWLEAQDFPDEMKMRRALQVGLEKKTINMSAAAEGLLLLMRWASPGYWEAWEARTFLYLEPLLDEPAEDIQALYEEKVWRVIRDRIPRMTSTEYTESVVLDWLNRRKQLGETLDEKSDARILPTMQAHQRLATTLHRAVSMWEGDDDLVGILGREHLPALKWGHGEWNLNYFLQHRLS